MLVAAQSAAAAVVTSNSGLGAWRAVSRNLDERLASFVKEPAIAREIEYFKTTIGTIRSAEALVADQRLFEFSLLAFDLEGQENAQGLMRKVLSENLSDSTSAANRMTDQRFKTMARAFGFAGDDAADKNLLTGFVQGYLRNEYERRTGDALPEVTTATQDEALATIALEPEIRSEIAYAKQALAAASSIDAATADARLMAFAQKAAGFETKQRFDADFLTRILEESDFREKLGDARWATFSSFFGHAREGRTLSEARNTTHAQVLVDKWVRASFTLETGRQLTGELSPSVEAELEAFAERSDNAAKIAEFENGILEVEDGAGLLSHPKVYNFVLRAFDLESFKRNPDLVLRAVEEKPSSRTSPACQDARFKALAEGLSFLREGGGSAVNDPAFIEQAVQNYVRIQFERAAGARDFTLRYALYAQRKLPKVTTAYEITADQPLRQFVLPAIGLPATSPLELEKLKAVIEKRVDMKKLGNKAYLEELTGKYFAQTASSSAALSPALSAASLAITLLSTSASASQGIDLSLLLQLQSAR